jgi:NAD(P)-dependent dehydrogenase (short-subunit alcohol dehydrogenase family)
VLRAAGADVVVAARRVDRIEALAADLGATAVPCDVADDAQCQALVDATVARYGKVDVLVNNAGVGVPVPAEDEPIGHFRDTVSVNLTAAYLLAQIAGRRMLDQGHGTIVNVVSMLGMVGAGQIPFPSYAASKGGLVNLTRELAAEWGRRGVRVNALAPGWFESEMTAEMFGDDRSMAWVRRKAPMGRAGEAHELDGALLFLASDASSYVTGQILAVDGGWTAV